MMIQTNVSPHNMAPTAHPTSSSRGEQHPTHRQVLDGLAKELVFAEAVVISSLPRGGLQIVQPHKVSEPFLKAYSKDFQGKDDVTWRAITEGAAVRADAKSPYVQEFLKTFGYEYVAAAPLQAPVFDGYAGAVQAVRTAEQGPFSDSDLRKLTDAARRFDALVASTRASRIGASDNEPVWTARPSTRQVVLDGRGKVCLFETGFDELDDRIRQQMVEEARQRIERLNGDRVSTSRILLPDSAGDHWTFNAVTFSSYPAISDGPVVFFCLQPSSPEWSTIRPSDFQADAEVSRLVPALKFMQQEFHRSPTLVEISKTVHLSPFHFHRRFTELMGLTPKHFLLECQIHAAKTQLLAGEKELAQIAADCGFAHQSHFTSRFKQATGLTPTRWRRMAIERSKNSDN
jgi:AraC-like DNA-binding protein